jgi:hypothetical protein
MVWFCACCDPADPISWHDSRISDITLLDSCNWFTVDCSCDLSRIGEVIIERIECLVELSHVGSIRQRDELEAGCNYSTLGFTSAYNISPASCFWCWCITRSFASSFLESKASREQSTAGLILACGSSLNIRNFRSEHCTVRCGGEGDTFLWMGSSTTAYYPRSTCSKSGFTVCFSIGLKLWSSLNWCRLLGTPLQMPRLVWDALLSGELTTVESVCSSRL